MDKVKELENTFNHGVSIAERKSIIVTGVKKIESFDCLRKKTKRGKVFIYKLF